MKRIRTEDMQDEKRRSQPSRTRTTGGQQPAGRQSPTRKKSGAETEKALPGTRRGAKPTAEKRLVKGPRIRPTLKKLFEAPKPQSVPKEERLQKVLAQAGIASRRHIEDMIREGAVTVNGKAAELGMKVDPAKDHIKVGGKLIRIIVAEKVYVMLNKPRGYVTTMSDPEARDTVMQMLKGLKTLVKPVGRLDVQTEGLLLFTNDGDLANAVMHPARELPKVYRAKVDGVLDENDFEKLRSGVRLPDGMTAPAQVRPLKKTETNSWIEITIHEGRNRQVRLMCEKIGHSVLKLRRTAIGPLSLGLLPAGGWRYLTPREVKLLKQAVS